MRLQMSLLKTEQVCKLTKLSVVCRWQAERRKHYPTEANVSRKSDAVAEREARGELEPDTALRRKRLQEVQSQPVST